MAPPYNIPKPMAKPIPVDPGPKPDPNWWKRVQKNQPTQSQINAWTEVRHLADLRLSAFQDKVLARCHSWEIAARNIGSAYAGAAKCYNEAMAKQDAIDALETQAIFSVLTVATSGAFSWVSSGLALAEEYPERRAIVGAMEGAAEAGIGEGFSALGPIVFSQTNQSVSINPQKFQNDRENAVSEAIIKVYDRFAAIKLEWAKWPLQWWNGYDEKAQGAEFDTWLRQMDTMAGKDDLPSNQEMTDELERGIWAKWMPSLKKGRWYTTAKDDMKFKEEYEGVGSAIEARLKALGILDMADVTIHWYQRAKTEDRKLIDWAQNYKVKDFQSMKRNK